MGVLDSLDALDAPSTAVPADELRQVKTLLWDIVRVNVAPAEVDEVKRALGTAAVDDNAQLMEEASALATIVGEVRRDVDDGAVARRLYENPARALVEGELRALVKSIRRTASGDSAEGSGRPPSGRPRPLVDGFLGAVAAAEVTKRRVCARDGRARRANEAPRARRCIVCARARACERAGARRAWKCGRRAFARQELELELWATAKTKRVKWLKLQPC